MEGTRGRRGLAGEKDVCCRMTSTSSYIQGSECPRLMLRNDKPHDLQDVSCMVGHLTLTEPVTILEQSKCVSLVEGERAVLRCLAAGSPLPNYQWFCGANEVPGSRFPELTFNFVCLLDAGYYTCRVNNSVSYAFSDWIKLEVTTNKLFGSRSMPIENSEEPESYSESLNSNFSLQVSDFLSAEMGLYATEKVALLIGNQNYMHHRRLRAPAVDVCDLTAILRQLNFRVMSLLDLRLRDMQTMMQLFLQILAPGVYGVLYYAGHGYENYGHSYLLPVDAPNPSQREHAVCVHSLLRAMQARGTALNLLLLDMCRKRNVYDSRLPVLENLEVTANIVFGYATCQDAEAYEVERPGPRLNNGLFMQFLKKRLLETEKVSVLLDRVAEDMGQSPLARGRQALEIRSNLSERRSLTDPVAPQQPSSSSSIYQRWARAHELPAPIQHDFPSGAQVRLCFAAEFSNVLVVFLRVLRPAQGALSSSICLTNLPMELNVDPKAVNRESIEDSGSPVLSAHTFPQNCVYTRLSGLQALQGSLTFTLELHSQLHDYVQCETLPVDVGCPLFAALDLQRPTCNAHNSGTNVSSRLAAEIPMAPRTGSQAGISTETNPQKCTSCMKCSANANSLPAVPVSTLPAVPTLKSSPKFASRSPSQSVTPKLPFARSYDVSDHHS
uniref:mucosa-associated lymphoid tissue lymphoma translocation protein 1-like isoform X2 n=1 Tax=Myxine glutinosa TaxID=7769 RepID=UPI00358EE499